jgi:hypothetical protein
MEDLKYEDLCEKLQNGEIGYLEFVTSQEELVSLYKNAMHINGLPENDATAHGWLQHYEEISLNDSASAEEVLPIL